MLKKRFPINGIFLLAIFLMVCLGITGSYQVHAVRAVAVEGSGSATTYFPFVSNIRVPSGLSLEPYVTGFTSGTITDIAHAGDGRLYVSERVGVVRIVEPNGTLLATPFLNITDRVASAENWELGLLSVAFHPDFPATPQVFVSYTRKLDFRIVLSRFTVNLSNPDLVDSATETVLLTIAKVPDGGEPFGISPVHNGGDIIFGPDGYLYVGFGDGGPDPNFGSTDPHDPANNGQRTDILLGNIIRIDVNPGTPGNLAPNCPGLGSATNYSVPPDNPYVGKDGCDEIWAIGLRNPWRISFDSLTGDMYIGDVGEWIFEEIDFIPAGENGQNFGWRCWEGTFDQTTPGTGHPIYADRCGTAADFDFPIFEYDSSGPACGVTGGFVYRGTVYEELEGFYVLADFCTGDIWVLKQFYGVWEAFLVGKAGILLSTFGEGVDGELYAGGYQNDTLYKVVVP